MTIAKAFSEHLIGGLGADIFCPPNRGAKASKISVATSQTESHLNIYSYPDIAHDDKPSSCIQFTPEAAMLLRDELLCLYPVNVASSPSRDEATPFMADGYVVIDSVGTHRGFYETQKAAADRAENIVTHDPSVTGANVYRKVVEVTETITYVVKTTRLG
jgi:hypothetical protein